MTACDKRIGIWIDGLKRIGAVGPIDGAKARIAADGRLEAWIIVRHVSKWWLSSKLQVKRAVFDIVENSEAASHYQLATAQRVPGKTKSRSEVIAVGINQSTIRGSGVASVQEVGRSGREKRGLLSGKPAHN